MSPEEFERVVNEAVALELTKGFVLTRGKFLSHKAERCGCALTAFAFHAGGILPPAKTATDKESQNEVGQKIILFVTSKLGNIRDASMFTEGFDDATSGLREILPEPRSPDDPFYAAGWRVGQRWIASVSRM